MVQNGAHNTKNSKLKNGQKLVLGKNKWVLLKLENKFFATIFLAGNR